MTVETAGLGHDPNEEGSKQWETLKDEDGSTTGWEDLGNSTPAPTPTTEIAPTPTPTPEATPDSTPEAGDETPGEELLSETELPAVEGFKEWYLKSKQEHPEIPEEEHLAQLKKGVAYQFDLTPEDSAKFKRIIKIITE